VGRLYHGHVLGLIPLILHFRKVFLDCHFIFFVHFHFFYSVLDVLHLFQFSVVQCFIAQHCCHFYELTELETEAGNFFPKWRINGIGPNTCTQLCACSKEKCPRLADAQGRGNTYVKRGERIRENICILNERRERGF
jgi:hypothetical protein